MSGYDFLNLCETPFSPFYFFIYATRIKIWISAHYPQPISCVVGLRKGSVKGPLLTIWWIDRKQSAGSRQTSDDIQTMSINKLGNMWVLLRRKCFDGDWFVSFIDAAWLMIFFLYFKYSLKVRNEITVTAKQRWKRKVRFAQILCS